MKTDVAIDAFVQRRNAVGRAFEPISAAPWIVSFEAKLPCRLPPSFRSLISRYRFAPFRLLGIEFFGNRGSDEPDELVIASLADPILVRVCHQHGLLQVGRPATGAYDPVCFDMSRRTKRGEAPLVCVDHEQILIHERVRVLREHAGSFEEAIREQRIF